METNGNISLLKKKMIFRCESCDYTTSRYYNYKKHNETLKHKNKKWKQMETLPFDTKSSSPCYFSKKNPYQDSLATFCNFKKSSTESITQSDVKTKLKSFSKDSHKKSSTKPDLNAPNSEKFEKKIKKIENKNKKFTKNSLNSLNFKKNENENMENHEKTKTKTKTKM